MTTNYFAMEPEVGAKLFAEDLAKMRLELGITSPGTPSTDTESSPKLWSYNSKTSQAEPVNYLPYIGIGAVLLFFFLKKNK